MRVKGFDHQQRTETLLHERAHLTFFLLTIFMDLFGQRLEQRRYQYDQYTANNKYQCKENIDTYQNIENTDDLDDKIDKARDDRDDRGRHNADIIRQQIHQFTRMISGNIRVLLRHHRIKEAGFDTHIQARADLESEMARQNQCDDLYHRHTEIKQSVADHFVERPAFRTVYGSVNQIFRVFGIINADKGVYAVNDRQYNNVDKLRP